MRSTLSPATTQSELVEFAPAAPRRAPQLTSLDRATTDGRLIVVAELERESKHAPVRVVVADSQPAFRIGIGALLNALPGVEVVGSATSESDAVALIDRTTPDVVFMDVGLGAGAGLPAETTAGIDATRKILARHPTIGVVILTTVDDDASLFAAIRAGARGYLLKSAGLDEVERAVHAAASGDLLLGASVAHRAISFLTAAKRAGGTVFPELTEREREVLELIARGDDNTAISRKLVLTSKTVRNYVYAIAGKLGASSRSTLIVMAREAGFGAAPERVPVPN